MSRVRALKIEKILLGRSLPLLEISVGSGGLVEFSGNGVRIHVVPLKKKKFYNGLLGKAQLRLSPNFLGADKQP